MQKWLGLAVLIMLDGGGISVSGTLMDFDDFTFSIQETAGEYTYPLSRIHGIGLGTSAPAS
jgi:hypothetical protein